MGLELIQLDVDLAASFYKLPRQAHKDPFDRMIVWLAIKKNFTLISKDAGLRVYTENGLRIVW